MKKVSAVYYGCLGVLIIIALIFLFSALPIKGNYKILSVQSGSMEPAIKTGSAVFIKPVSTGEGKANYKIGDVITFGKAELSSGKISKTQTPTTHRIYDIKVNVGEIVYITKGDANNAPDKKEVSEKEVIGKVFFSLPYLGHIVSAVRTRVGFSLIIIVPALLVIIDEVYKIKNELKKQKTIS